MSYSADQYGICARLSRVGQVLYDKQLCVWTSSRRVRGKPLAVVVGDGAEHVLRWAGHCFGQVMTGLRRTVVPAPSGSAAAWSLVALVIVFMAYGYLVPTSPVFGKVYFKGSPTAGNLVALTFDDGPNEPYTSQILGILDRYSIRATFFVIGRNVELYPGIARRILAERHVLGNHSYSHNANHAVTQSGSKDLELAQLAIFLVTGVKPHLYRPPHGKKSPWELRSLKKESLIEVTWSVAANELRIRSAESLSEKIAARTDPGEIILLHDGYGTTHDSPGSDKSLTVQALPLVIEKLLAKGYRFVTVPELLRVPAYND